MGWDQPKNRTNQGLSVKTRQLQLWTLIKLWNQYASNLSHVHIWLMGQNVSHNWHIMWCNGWSGRQKRGKGGQCEQWSGQFMGQEAGWENQKIFFWPKPDLGSSRRSYQSHCSRGPGRLWIVKGWIDSPDNGPGKLMLKLKYCKHCLLVMTSNWE